MFRPHPRVQAAGDLLVVEVEEVEAEAGNFLFNYNTMKKQFLRDALGWGFLLWLFGYLLGIVLFPVAPNVLLGWAIMPFGIALTLWVLFKKVKGTFFSYYLLLALIWTLIAIVFDYTFLVKVFNPADGYYKLDVYLYYIITFVLPLIIGRIKTGKKSI
jgi:hypothetical protein